MVILLWFPPAVLEALRQAINYAGADPLNGSHISHHGWSQQRCLPLALDFLKKELGVVDPPSGTAPLKKRKRAPRKKPSPSEDESEDPKSDLTDLETEEEDNSNPEPGPSVINRPSTSISHQSAPTPQEIEQAQIQLKEFRSMSEAQLDGSNLTETQKLEFRRHVEEMEKILYDLEE